MTTTERQIAAPERSGGQGLDPNQEESGNRAIHALLDDPTMDWVATYRYGRRPAADELDPLGLDNEVGAPDIADGAYEVWARRGMVRFHRFISPEGGYGYEVTEQAGENPIANQDPTAVATIVEELEAAAKPGRPGGQVSNLTPDLNQAFMEPESLSYPLAYERIAQLFDSPNAPDIVVNPKSYAFGRQPGQHGAADVVQSRAPLVFSGPGVKQGVTQAICAQVDVAPTLAKLLGLPLIDGMDGTGRTSSERGVPPDVYLKRQDGRVIQEVLDPDGERPERVYIMLLDGLSNSELKERIQKDKESIPNLARIIDRGLMFEYGTTVNFPSITWPSHNALGTGAWCGHHDVVNPTYYLRETKQTVTPQGMQFDTARFVGPGVETLYEAVRRVYGEWNPAHPEASKDEVSKDEQGVVTASINEPCVRGATHATLERRLLVDTEVLRATVREHKDDTSPRWKEDGREEVYRASGVDIQGLAQSLLLFDHPELPAPKFTYHEFSLTDSAGHDYGPHGDGIFDAMIETDRRIGKVLALLDRKGLFEGTLFVITTDHGMAPTDVSLAANQVQAVLDAGLKAVVPAPLVYLLDMEVVVAASGDGRTVTVTVRDNDADSHGDKRRIPGARVQVFAPERRVVAEAKTDEHGVCGLPLPVDIDPSDLVVSVHHDDFNPRHLRLDGTNVVEDIRERHYGGV